MSSGLRVMVWVLMAILMRGLWGMNLRVVKIHRVMRDGFPHPRLGSYER